MYFLKHFTYSFFVRFVVILILTSVPFGLIGYMYYNNKVQKYYITLLKEQENTIALEVNKIEEQFQNIYSEVLTISNQQSIIDFLKKKDIISKEYSEDHFLHMMHFYTLYDQMRILDANGMEVLKVNRIDSTATIVGNQDLQNKANRYYFKATKKLNKGDIFVSALDLSIDSNDTYNENKPVLRISSPIFDNRNTLIGVGIIDINGERILHNLRSCGKLNRWKTWLINNSGYYLIGPSPDKEWTFLKGDKDHGRFYDDYPEIYPEIIGGENHTIKSTQGVFEVKNLDNKNTKLGYLDGALVRDKWIVVSMLENEDIKTGLDKLFDIKDSFLLFFSIILALGITFIITFNSHRKAKFQEQLINSERQLQIAIKTKDRFISVLAHDLKNPISSIAGVVEILSKEDAMLPANTKAKLLTVMENSTKHLLSLIEDVLTWSRSHSGNLVPEAEIVLSEQLIEESIKFCEVQAQEKGITLIKNVPEETFVNADPKMIETVIRNLISNAIKFSYRNSTIEIKAVRFRGKRIRFDVADHGMGMPHEVSTSLFALDKIASTPGTENERGTGMGLILCKDFIEKNNGKIWLKSELNKGTTISFVLPEYEFEEETEDNETINKIA